MLVACLQRVGSIELAVVGFLLDTVTIQRQTNSEQRQAEDPQRMCQAPERASAVLLRRACAFFLIQVSVNRNDKVYIFICAVSKSPWYRAPRRGGATLRQYSSLTC